MSKGIINRPTSGFAGYFWLPVIVLLALGLGLVSESAEAQYTWARTQVMQNNKMEKAVAFGDLDGDGDLDMAMGYQSGEWPATWSSGITSQFTIRCFRNNGNQAAWTEFTNSPYYWTTDAWVNSDQYGGFNKIDVFSDIKIANINGTGHNDLVFCTHVEGVRWLPNLGSGNFGTQATNAPISFGITRPNGTSTNYYPNVRKILPVNLDPNYNSSIDLVVAQAETNGYGSPNMGSVIRAFYNTGSGNFFTEILPSGNYFVTAETIQFTVGLRAFDLTPGDGTGRPEIIVTGIGATDTVRIINTTTTTQTSGITVALNATVGPGFGADPFDVGVGDIGGNTSPDLVVFSSKSPTVVWYEGTNSTTAPTAAHVIDNSINGVTNDMSSCRNDNYPVYGFVTDLNNDWVSHGAGSGYDDVVASYCELTDNANGLVRYYMNNGSGGFTAYDLPTGTSDTHPMMIELNRGSTTPWVAQQEFAGDSYSTEGDRFKDLIVACMGSGMTWPTIGCTPPHPSGGTGTVSFYNNRTYLSYVPNITNAIIEEEGNPVHTKILLTFSKAMYNGTSQSEVDSALNPQNYTISGAVTTVPGFEWTNFKPNLVQMVSAPGVAPAVYRLVFNDGRTLADGKDIRITSSYTLYENDGVLPPKVPLNPVASVAAKYIDITCRMDLTVTNINTYIDYTPTLVATTIVGSGCSFPKQYRWMKSNLTDIIRDWTVGGDSIELKADYADPFTLVDNYKCYAYVRNGDGTTVPEVVRTDEVTVRALQPPQASIPYTTSGSKNYGYMGKSGDSFTMTVTASLGYGPPEFGNYTYRWYQHNGTTYVLLPNAPTVQSPNPRLVDGDPEGQEITTTISGGWTPTLSVTNGLFSYEDKKYKCVVTDSNGRPVDSNEVWVRLGDNPNVYEQPTGGRKYVGNPHTFTAKVMGGISPYYYVWQKANVLSPDVNNPAHWTTAPGSPTTREWDIASLDLSYNFDANNPGIYRLQVTDSQKGQTGYSDPVTLQVRPPVSFSVQPASSITLDTYSDLLPGGDADPFVVTVTGGYPDVWGYTYEWRRDIGAGVVPVPNDGTYPRTMYPGSKEFTINTTFAGKTTAHLTIENALRSNGGAENPVLPGPPLAPVILDEGIYYCYVTDGNPAALAGYSKTTDPSTLTLTDHVKVLEWPCDSAPKYAGESTQYTIRVIGGSGPYYCFGCGTLDPSGQNGQFGYSFFWKRGPTSFLPGDVVINGGVCTIDATNLITAYNGSIWCDVLDSMPPSATPFSVPGDLHAVALPVKAAIAVTSLSGPTHANTSTNISWTVTSSNGYAPPFAYVWSYSGDSGATWTPLANGGRFGMTQNDTAKTATLSITNVALGDAGQYKCETRDMYEYNVPCSGTPPSTAVMYNASRSRSFKESAAKRLTVTEVFAVDALVVHSSTWSPENKNKLYVGDAFTLRQSVTAGAAPGTYTGAAPYTYTWKKGTTTVRTITKSDGYDDYVVSTAVLGDAGTYTCTVTNSGSDPNPPANGSQTMQVFSAVDGDPDGATPKQENVGNPMSFTVAPASGCGWDQTLVYQWQKYDSGLGDWVDVANSTPPSTRITGAKAAKLNFQSLELGDAGDYRCVVIDAFYTTSADARGKWTSGTFTLTVTNFMNFVRDGNPIPQTVYVGDTITMTINVLGGEPGPGGYYYYWYKEAGATDTLVGTAQTLTLTPAALTDTGLYYVEVDDDDGTTPNANPPIRTDQPAFADIGLKQVAVYRPVAVTAPLPISDAVYVGDPVSFSVMGSEGIPLPVVTRTYQWFIDQGSGFSPILENWAGFTGVATRTLSTPAADISLNGASFRCLVTAGVTTDALADPAKVLADSTETSASASLIVVKGASYAMPPDEAVYAGADADPAFSIAATVEYGLNKDTFEWQRRLVTGGTFSAVTGGSGPFGDGNSAVLTVDPAVESANDYAYRVQVVDEIKTTTSPTNTNITFANHLKIESAPGDKTAPKGERIEFKVVLSGGLGVISKQWSFQPKPAVEEGTKDWTNVFPPNVSGAGSTTLVIDGLAKENEGDYMFTAVDSGSTQTGPSEPVTAGPIKLTVGAYTPVAGPLGLAAFAMAASLAGVLSLRRRRK